MNSETARKVARPVRGALTDDQYCRLLDEIDDALQAQLASAVAAETAECRRIALAHKSKIEVNGPLWHEGQDWAAQRIADAIEARLPSDTLKRLEAERAVIETAHGVLRAISANSGSESSKSVLARAVEELDDALARLDAPQPAQEEGLTS